MVKWLRSLSKNVIYLIALILFGLIAVDNFTYFNSSYFPFKLTSLVIVGLAGALLLASIISFYLCKWLLVKAQQYQYKYVIALVFGIGIILRLLWIFFVRPPVIKDYQEMYQASLQAMQGDFSFMHNVAYFVLSPYQIGLVLYESAILKIVGNHIVVLKLLNILWQFGTGILVQRLTLRVTNSRAASLFAVMFYVFYIPNIALCSVLTNQIVALFFLLLSVDLFLEGNHFGLALLSGLFLAIGNLLRPLGSIILIAYVLWTIFIVTKKQKSKLVNLVLIGLMYFGCNFTLDQVLQKTNVTTASIETVNSDWKFVLGLNYKSDGKWNLKDYTAVEKYKSQVKREKFEKKLIKQRLENKSQLSRLMIRKFRLMWSDFDTSISWGTRNSNLSQTTIVFLTILQRVMYLLAINLALLALIRDYKEREKLTHTFYFVLILVIGYILIHEGIEIQTRYRYFIMPFFTVVAACWFKKGGKLM